MAAQPDILFAVLIWIGVGLLFTVVNAVLVRAACDIANTNEPRFGKACFVSLLSAIAYFALSMISGFVLVLVMQLIVTPTMAHDDFDSVQESMRLFTLFAWIAQGMVVVFWGAASGAMYKLFIPLPTFGRAMLVWLITFGFWIVIAVVVGGIIAGAIHYYL